MSTSNINQNIPIKEKKENLVNEITNEIELKFEEIKEETLSESLKVVVDSKKVIEELKQVEEESKEHIRKQIAPIAKDLKKQKEIIEEYEDTNKNIRELKNKFELLLVDVKSVAGLKEYFNKKFEPLENVFSLVNKVLKVEEDIKDSMKTLFEEQIIIQEEQKKINKKLDYIIKNLDEMKISHTPKKKFLGLF